tara:strand:- start:3130 stop:3729 length:600 start_codon:yes stop_codon:yes gene_type:complete
MIKKVKIKSVSSNPVNPRLIKEDKFQKLVQSVKDFPEMLQLRPIVVNEKMEILGGNMRYKACQSLGHKEIYIIKAENLTRKQMEEFVIKDNSSFGEWDWNLLANMWEVEQLTDWGVNVYDFSDKDVNMVNAGDENSEWIGLPEFEGSEKEPKLIIAFESEDLRDEFIAAKDIKISSKAKMTWSAHYPFRERESYKEQYE